MKMEKKLLKNTNILSYIRHILYFQSYPKSYEETIRSEELRSKEIKEHKKIQTFNTVE